MNTFLIKNRTPGASLLVAAFLFAVPMIQFASGVGHYLGPRFSIMRGLLSPARRSRVALWRSPRKLP